MFHTRPNIAYAVSMVSQFMHPILRYLKLTPGKGLLFSKNNQLRVEAYKKLDWVDSITVGDLFQGIVLLWEATWFLGEAKNK